ncbi:hypothetical protein GCM10023350_29540 [Nocardioides endophyticus]|uniref:Uncharacterized protein n=1 Tax=Nocardioides endophyticus TaxID=1353775 RepID=A0ABP8Z008_9ACTN
MVEGIAGDELGLLVWRHIADGIAAVPGSSLVLNNDPGPDLRLARANARDRRYCW